MFRNGKQIGFREHNGNNIDSTMHFGKKVFEQGYDAKASGQNEITLDGTIGKDLRSYEIIGDLYQEWTPSPEPQIGENLLDNSKIEKGSTISNFNYTSDTITYAALTVGSVINSAEIKTDTTSYAYSFAGDTSKVTVSLKCYDASHTYLGDGNKLFDEVDRAVVTTLANTAYIRLVVTSTIQGNISLNNVMLNKGGQVKTFEPYTILPKTGPCEVKGVGDRTENLWEQETTISRTSYYDYTKFVPAGTVLSFEIVSSDTDSNDSLVMLSATDGSPAYRYVLRDRRVSVIVDHDLQRIRFYASKDYATSQGDTFTVSNIMLNTGSTPLPYEPYGYKAPVVTRGKNLFDINTNNFAVGYLSQEGTISQSPNNIVFLDYMPTYHRRIFIKFNKKVYNVGYVLYDNQKNSIARENVANSLKISVDSASATYMRFWVNLDNGHTVYNPLTIDELKPLDIIVTDDENSSYTPYHPPITTNLYLPTPLAKGEVLSSDGSREVKWGVKVFDGSEAWVVYGSAFYTHLDNPIKRSYALCSHLLNVYIDDSAGNNCRFYWSAIGFNVLDEWKLFLKSQYDAGIPVTVYYQLDTPTTEQIDMPTIPTFKDPDFTPNGQTTILSIDTEVSPESTKIEYRANKYNDPMLYATQDNKLYATRNGEVYSTWR